MLVSRDPLSQKISNFNKESEDTDKQIAKVKKRFGADEPILGFDEINETLDDAEDRHTTLLASSVSNLVSQWLVNIEKPLENLDEDAIAKTPLNIAGTIQGLLMNLWREIFKTGSRAGITELNELSLAEREKTPEGLFSSDDGNGFINFARNSPEEDGDRDAFINRPKYTKFSRTGSNLNFARKDNKSKRVSRSVRGKPVFEVAYPPDNADLDVIEVEELRDALNLRTQVLADDLSQGVSDRIDRIIKDSVDSHTTVGNKVTKLNKRERTKIVRQINGVIGYERQQQRKKGVPESELARTQIEVPGSDYFIKRAQMIASTELNSGYNMGRLQSYSRSKVKFVRWQTIGDSRTCNYCESRSGTLMPLNTVLTAGLRYSSKKTRRSKYNKFEYFLPAHPFCRCAWQAATDAETKDKKRGAGAIMAPVPLAGNWGKVGAAAGLMSSIGTAGRVLTVAERITREKQLQEKAKRRARNRTMLAAGGALSLGALSIGLYSWLNRPKTDIAKKNASTPGLPSVPKPEIPETLVDKVQAAGTALVGEEAIEKSVQGKLVKNGGQLAKAAQKREKRIRETPVTPVTVMRGNNIVKANWSNKRKQDYQKFMESNVDLKTVTDAELISRHNLRPEDIKSVRQTQSEFEKNLGRKSSFEGIEPASVISPETIVKHPWLADVKDIRELSEDDMVAKGMEPQEANRIYTSIYKKIRSSGGLAAVDSTERKVLSKLNNVKDKEELADLLKLTKNERTAVPSLFKKIQDLKAKGKRIRSLSEIKTIRNIGDKTVANMLADAEGAFKINEVLAGSDKGFALERLQTIPGVGSATAEAIYEALQDTGQQFLDADDFVRKIEPYVKARGGKLSPITKRNFGDLIDFNYLPGLDRQPVNFEPPKIPGQEGLVERRGDIPQFPQDQN